MTELSLVLHGMYERADGTQTKIVKLIELDESAPRETDWLFDKGFRFIDENDDSYLPNGRFDADEGTSLDLIKPVARDFMVAYTWNDFEGEYYEIVNAANPADAILNFKSDVPVKPVRVYEIKDVTPREPK